MSALVLVRQNQDDSGADEIIISIIVSSSSFQSASDLLSGCI